MWYLMLKPKSWLFNTSNPKDLFTLQEVLGFFIYLTLLAEGMYI